MIKKNANVRGNYVLFLQYIISSKKKKKTFDIFLYFINYANRNSFQLKYG